MLWSLSRGMRGRAAIKTLAGARPVLLWRRVLLGVVGVAHGARIGDRRQHGVEILGESHAVLAQELLDARLIG